MTAAVSTTTWTCPSCRRPTVVTGSDADIACCVEAVRQRHEEGHATTSPRANARARRAASRAAARRRANQNLRRTT